MDENAMGNIIAALIGKDGDGLGGNGGIWMIFLLFILLIGGGGLWGGNRGPAMPPNVATQSDVTATAAWQTTQTGLQGVTDAINGVNQNLTSLGYTTLTQANAINQNISQQGADSRLQACENTHSITNGIANLGYAVNNGQQNIERSIDQVRFDNAQQTCAITTNDTANTQKVLDAICELKTSIKDAKIQEQAAQIASLQSQVANQALASSIISTLQPNAKPAYLVSSPYTSLNPCGCGTTFA